MDLPIIPILVRNVERFLGQKITPEIAAQLVASVVVQCYPGPMNVEKVLPKVVGSYTLRPALLSETVDELRAIHEQHWQETEDYRHGVGFNPDYERCIDLENQGKYLLLVAEHTRSHALVGNYGLFIGRSLHTQQLEATEDTLFLSKDHRRGRLGVEFIRYAEDTLRQLGVSEIGVLVKLVNEVGPMIVRMGYAPTGTKYTKILKEPGHVHLNT